MKQLLGRAFLQAVLLLTCTFCVGGKTSTAGSADLAAPAGLCTYLKTQPAVLDAQPWDNDFGPGLAVITQHYEIRTTLLDPLVLTAIGAFLESAHRAYQDQLAAPVRTQFRFGVYLFASRGQWEAFTREFAGAAATAYLQIQEGAYCLNGECVAYNIGIRDTFSALAHEGWHQFNSRHFAYRLPSWLDEGVATLFESRVERGGRFRFEPAGNLQRLGTLKQAINGRGLLELQRLISLNPGQLIDDAEAMAGFYAQSYALVRFLREDNYGSRLASYRRLLNDAAAGSWPLDAQTCRIAADRDVPLTAAFNRDVSQRLFSLYVETDAARIEGEYLAFCAKLASQVRIKRPVSTVSTREPDPREY